MDHMIDAIRSAVTEGATAEQKAAGAQACRTILAALEAEVGKALALPGAPAPHPLAQIDPGQALDLLIAKLRAALPVEGEHAADAKPLRITLVAPPRRKR
jgi:hypothetical protein